MFKHIVFTTLQFSSVKLLFRKPILNRVGDRSINRNPFNVVEIYPGYHFKFM